MFDRDDRLARAAARGDDSAFEALYRRHHPAVLAFCRRLLGRADEAQDAAQHAFEAAYRALGSGQVLEAVRPWLFTVARNRCLSIMRARREAPEELAEPATEGLALQAERRADLRDVLGDLAELPDDQRTALLLAEIADFSHREIASVLGVRREKVKALVFQARESLLAGRTARELPCAVVRSELATARGAALRRAPLRRHLHACPGCREFRDGLRNERRGLGSFLPLGPVVALRDALLGGAATASGGVGTAKVAVCVAVAGGALVGGPALDGDRVPPAGGERDGAAAPRASGAPTAGRREERATFAMTVRVPDEARADRGAAGPRAGGGAVEPARPSISVARGHGDPPPRGAAGRSSPLRAARSAPASPGRPTTPSHGGRPATPSHGGRPARPSHGGRPTTPSHGGRSTTPSHGGRSTTPSHGGRSTTPSHGGRSTTPSHGGRSDAPPPERGMTPSGAARPNTSSLPHTVTSRVSQPGDPSPARPTTPSRAARPDGPSAPHGVEPRVLPSASAGSPR